MTGTTALYLRISLDDEKQSESDSIANQRDLLRSYISVDPSLSAGEVLEFSDDGWSGTNFERPQVKALLHLARQGKVKNILVKDLSRWGRNYPEVSEYLDQIFPFLGVRFISVNDHYDSNDYKGQTAPMDVAFNSIMHDIYCKDLSVKVRQSQTAKAKKGEYVCGTTPYGYTRSKTVKNLLEIDEGAASTIRRIYNMACEGCSTTKIAAALNADGVDTALANRRRNGRSTLGMKPINGRTYWCNGQILRILKDERYTGLMICYKTKKVTPGSKKQIKRPESEWIKTPGAHEAIITVEQFAKVQSLLRSNKNTAHGVARDRSPFTGKIICGHCGRVMRQRFTKRSYHFCEGPKLGWGQGCYEGKMYIDDLKDIVLSAVRAEAQKVYDANQKRKQAVRRESSDSVGVLAELNRLKAQIALLERRGVKLYEDFADRKLDKDGYLSAKTACADELSDAQARSDELTNRLDILAQRTESPDGGPLLRRILDTEDVTPEVLSLVDRIVVYDSNRIEIRLAFKDTNSPDSMMA